VSDLVRIELNGSFTPLLQSNLLLNARGMAFDSNGLLFISDKQGGDIDIYTSGLLSLDDVTFWGRIDYELPYQFGGPTYVAFNSAGDLFINVSGPVAATDPFGLDPPDTDQSEIIRITRDQSSLRGQPIIIPLSPVAVPLPAAMWLLGSALLGIVAWGRRSEARGAGRTTLGSLRLGVEL
jgi:hypothetical protein